jgi:cysteine desulfurase
MTGNRTTYLDHNATTPVAEAVRLALPRLAEAWGNASSIHQASRDPKQILRETRRDLAQILGCSALELIFTSGGSESNNTILKSVWFDRKNERPHFLTSSIEHPSVLKTMAWLKDQGAEVDVIPVNRRGEIDLEFYRRHLTSRTALVSVMAANNETGTLLPIRDLAAMAHDQGILFHTDAVQMFGKLPLNLSELGVDYASFSAHKVYSVKGTGLLFAKKGTPLSPLIHGGGQERHRRGGTENILGIGALGVALTLFGEIGAESDRQARLRDHFEARVLSEIENVMVTAGETPRLPNTSSLVLAGVDGETLLMSLDLKNYAVSTGAACSAGNPEPSPVLLAMGLSRDEAQNSLRVSFGRGNTLEDVDSFVETLKSVTERLRRLNAEVLHA